jgi:hypothetical protein
MFLNDYYIAILLAFPPAMTHLCQRFKVPENLQKSDSLVVTLIPWAITAEQANKEWRKPYDGTRLIQEILTGNDRSKFLRSKRKYCRGLRVLKFPKALHDFMSKSNRTYCLWSTGDDDPADSPHIETEWLTSILDVCQAKNVGLKILARVLFIHVGALKKLQNLPDLVDRRSKHPEIQFYTYGTHESVVPERWGIREIFPIGERNGSRPLD